MTITRSDYPDATIPHRPIHDPWMLDRMDPDYLGPDERWCILCTKPDSHPIHERKDDNR